MNKADLGYIYDLPAWNHMKWGVSVSVDVSIIPDKLKESYGNNPVSYVIFARIKLD